LAKKKLYIFFNSFDMLMVKIIIFKNFSNKKHFKKKNNRLNTLQHFLKNTVFGL